MRGIKIEIMFEYHNKDFERVLGKHYTSVNKLCNGDDAFDYNGADVIAKRQFTGLKDINGVDIYEGDVIKSHFYGEDAGFECVAQIKYSSGRAAFVFDSSEQDAFVYGNESNLLEVIGNIYENPELLK